MFLYRPASNEPVGSGSGAKTLSPCLVQGLAPPFVPSGIPRRLGGL